MRTRDDSRADAHAARARVGADARNTLVAESPAQQYLDRVRAATRSAAPTVGRGSYSVLTGEVIGGELSDAGRVVHLAAFPTQPARGSESQHAAYESPLAPPSVRRRHPRR